MATNPPAGGGTADFIGALISLVSKSDIRYQGILSQIDAVQATIALEHVKSYGTEGRMSSQGKPQDEIPPGETTYPLVTFRAADVKDLRIDDPHPPKPQPQPQPSFVDPAILGASPPDPRYGRPGPPGGPYGYPNPGQWGPPPPHPAAYGGYGPGPFMGPAPPHFGGPGGPPPPPPSHSGPSSSPQIQQRPAQSTPQQAAPASQTPSAPAANLTSPSKPIPKGPKAVSPVKQTNGALNNVPKGPANKAGQAGKDADKGAVDQVVADLEKLNVGSNTAQKQSEVTSPASQPPKPAAARSPAVSANLPARPVVPRGTSGTVPGTASRTPRGPPTSVFDNAVSRNGASHVEVPSSDFDFESANAKFAKEKEAGGGAKGNEEVLDAIPPPKEEAKSFYDKSSFFDNISSEVRERHDRATSPRRERGSLTTGFDSGGASSNGHEVSTRGGRGGGRGGARQARFEEDRKNLDTFGEVGPSRGGAGGRGGRGGRGRGRGRGRGGPRGGAATGIDSPATRLST